MSSYKLKFKDFFKPSTYTRKTEGSWRFRGMPDKTQSDINRSFGLSPGKKNKIPPSELVASCFLNMVCETIELPILLVVVIVLTALFLFLYPIAKVLNLCFGDAYQRAKLEESVKDGVKTCSNLAIYCGLFIGSAVLFVASTLLLPFEGAARIYDACVQGGNEPAQAK